MKSYQWLTRFGYETVGDYKNGINTWVPNSTVDKDWILGHILNACYHYEELRSQLVFKGGTCLRKCWIENYRFSEDLDFTLLDPEFPVSIGLINKILRFAQDKSGAFFHIESFKEQRWRNVPQGYLTEIKFWGADHHPNQRPLPPSRWLTMIHIDINYTEPLLYHTIERSIIHPYSDFESITSRVISYSFLELVAEKIRALQQRNRPRDIYDVYTMSSLIEENDIPVIQSLLFKKCKVKQLPAEDLSLFVNPLKQKINERHWNNALKHQILPQKLPAYQDTYQSVTSFLQKLMIKNRNILKP